MIKSITTFFCLSIMSFSLLFGSSQPGPSGGPPGRGDKLDSTSQYARGQS